MKVRRLVLCLFLSVALVVTFIPMVSFGADGDGEWRVAIVGLEQNEGNAQIDEGDTAILEVEVENCPEGAEPAYQWYIFEGDYDDDDNPIPGDAIAGETSNTYETGVEGGYLCGVTIEGVTKYSNLMYVTYNDESGDDGPLWVVNAIGDDVVYLDEDGEAQLEVEVDTTACEEVPSLTYQWFYSAYDEQTEEYLDETKIPGATGLTYTAQKPGGYCFTAIEEGEDYSYQDSVWFYVYSEEEYWSAFADQYTIYIPYGETATLSARTDYNGTEEIQYQWYSYEGYDEDYKDIWEKINGANSATYITDVEGDYKCDVTIDGVTDSVYIYVYYDTEDYQYQVQYPNATAVYQAAGPSVIDYVDSDNDTFPQEGDVIAVTNGNQTIEYVYSTHGTFVYTDEEGNEDELYLEWDEDWDVDVKGGKVYAYLYSPHDYDHENKIVYVKYDIDMVINVTVNTDISSMTFGNNNISVYSEDVKQVEDGETHYYLGNRCKYTDGEESWTGCFANGETVTVAYKDGRKVKYTFDSGEFVYEDPATGDRDNFSIYAKDDSLKAGNNKVEFWRNGVSTTLNVFMDTPQLRAQRAAEAARQGTYSGSMPAVKASKPKAAKKAITVKWKKLKKKQLKSGVSNIEVWVSTNTAFARGATIEKTVGKKKASVKIKGLKKGTTYFAKVRAIKYVNGKKVVGKWSTIKKVKVKK